MKTSRFALSTRKLFLGALAVGLVAAGCSSSKSTTGSSSSGTGGTSNLDHFVVSYVGGSAKQATGSTIEIGMVNSNSGPAAFPSFTSGAQAAVAYANSNLDGIKGHVIKLDVCSIGSEEDGQACGAQMVNNTAINAILEGVVVVGGDTFFKVINNTKVVLQVSANSTPDLFPYQGVIQPNVFTLNAGAVGGYDALLAYAAKNLNPTPKSILFIGDNVPAAKTGIQSFQGQLAQYHIPTKAVYVDPSAGAAQVASNIQSAGGASADVWFMLSDLNMCVNAMSYKFSAGLHPVVMGAQCIGSAMKAITGGAYAPDGLIETNTGETYWLPQESPIQQVINTTIDRAVPNDPSPDAVSLAFQQILNLIRAMNAATDEQSSQSIATAIRNLAPPIIDNLGPIRCGAVPLFATLCGQQIGLIEAKGKSWVRLSPTAQVPVFTVWQFKA